MQLLFIIIDSVLTCYLLLCTDFLDHLGALCTFSCVFQAGGEGGIADTNRLLSTQFPNLVQKAGLLIVFTPQSFQSESSGGERKARFISLPLPPLVPAWS